MFVFHLPGGAEADLEGIIDAMLEVDDYPQYYLDTEIGSIVRIATDAMLAQWIEEVGHTDRYLLIPRIDDDERSMLAATFIDEIMMGEVSAHELRETRVALAEGAWELFELYLADEHEDFEMIWEQFIEDHAFERAHRWLIDEHIGAQTSFEGCGQCALCEALARGEDDPDTLLDAFMTEEVMERVGRQMEEIKAQGMLTQNSAVAEKSAPKTSRSRSRTTPTKKRSNTRGASSRVSTSSKKSIPKKAPPTQRKRKQ